jgi:dGTPase
MMLLLKVRDAPRRCNLLRRSVPQSPPPHSQLSAHPPPLPGERWRAPYATDPRETRGRLIPEPGSPTRSPFQRDRDRVIHSGAFRRLQHKTQVFVYHEGDSFRTRLTHTIEVSQIARALARSLGLDEDLAEALALSHDLGHTPFGHTGEDALDACLAEAGGFDHNAQALRIVTRLERRYAAFDGLNLSWETLEGLVKHNGPLIGPDGGPTPRYAARGVPLAILDYDAAHPLELATQAGPEAQAAALADDIAYNAHDIDDGLRAGILAIEELRAVPFIDDLLREIDAAHPGLEPSRRVHELTRRVITRHVEDVLTESGRRLAQGNPGSAAGVRALPEAVVAFSPAMAAADAGIKGHLFPMLYRHPRIMAVRRDAEAIVRDLFGRFMAAPSLLPADWAAGLAGAAEPKLARRVGDYIAGMTDRYAILEHRRLFPTTPDLRVT